MACDLDDAVKRAVELCRMTQCMIDITAKQLDGLRTVCSTAEQITQKEIRESETKLIKLFSKQLVVKAKLNVEKLPRELWSFPKMEQWLTIVGVQPRTRQGLISQGMNVEWLMTLSDESLVRLMRQYEASKEDISRLKAALHNLKKCTDCQLHGDKKSESDLQLHWSSYTSSATNSPHPSGANSPMLQRPSTSSLPPDTYLNSQTSPVGSPGSLPPSPATPRLPLSPQAAGGKSKLPTTPPPQKRNMLYPEAFQPLTKSKSHESQLGTRVNQETTAKQKKKPDDLVLAGSYDALYQQRKRSTEGSSGQASPLMPSPKRSPPYKHSDQVSLPDMFDVHPNKKNQLSVPVSPNTGAGTRSMLHFINHSFQNKLIVGGCDLCHKRILIGKCCQQCK